jgi:hypothetical protein
VCKNNIIKDYDYSMYHYYKGEDENPYANILDKAEIENPAKYPPASMRVEYNLPFEEVIKLSWSLRFWEREKLFETLYNKNDFSLKMWNYNGEDRNKWVKVLNPVDKKGLFELWNNKSLNQISEKNEMSLENIYNLYIKYSR